METLALTWLAGALDRDEIEVLFQPQFAAHSGQVVGAEALARWRHPQLGRMGAETLFTGSRRPDQAARLSRHIARAALAAAAEWPAPLRLSLNVTPGDLAADDFADWIARAVGEAGFAPERLTLEITEGSLLAELDRPATRLRQLAGLGMRIALDDFGAGFCNFNYLKRLPLHCLKLDRSMIQGIDEDPRDLAVLRAIVTMAEALGLEVIAEGVERESQRATVVNEGCAAWQGFLGAAPMMAAELARLAR